MIMNAILNDTHEMLFLVARDFVQLTPIEQVSIGMKLGLVGVEIAMEVNKDMIAESIFSKAYYHKRIPDLVKEMRPYLYE